MPHDADNRIHSAQRKCLLPHSKIREQQNGQTIQQLVENWAVYVVSERLWWKTCQITGQ